MATAMILSSQSTKPCLHKLLSSSPGYLREYRHVTLATQHWAEPLRQGDEVDVPDN